MKSVCQALHGGWPHFPRTYMIQPVPEYCWLISMRMAIGFFDIRMIVALDLEIAQHRRRSLERRNPFEQVSAVIWGRASRPASSTVGHWSGIDLASLDLILSYFLHQRSMPSTVSLKHVNTCHSHLSKGRESPRQTFHHRHRHVHNVTRITISSPLHLPSKGKRTGS